MKMQALVCPNCHANLDNDAENLGTFFCKYCGQKIIVEELQDAAYKAKVREMELEHEEKKMEFEQKKKNIEYQQRTETEKRNNKGIWIILASCVILYAVLMFILGGSGRKHDRLVKQLRQTEQEVQVAIQEGNYDYAMIKVNELRLDDNYSDDQTKAWDEKREDYIALIKSKQNEKK